MVNDTPGTDQDNRYRYQTRRITVDVVFGDGGESRGDLHLQPTTMHTGGYETTLECLNRPEEFFAIALEGGEVVLLAKSQVAMLSHAREEVDDLEDELQPATTAELDVTLTQGLRCQGRARWQLPPSHNRPLDYLNSADRFIQLENDQTLFYLHRAHLRSVTHVR